MKAMASLAKHVHALLQHGFEYVLAGEFIFDPLEGWLGWYHHVNGGKFLMYTSIHFMQKKICCLRLLQHQALLLAYKDY